MAKEPAKTSEKEAAGQVPARREGYLHPIQQLREEMDQLFDSFFGRSLMRWPRSLFDWEPELFRGFRTRAPLIRAPQVDVRESDKEYVIEAELPGMSEKDVELVLKDDVLTLKGEKKSEREEEEEEYHIAERSWGAFERSFRLPEGVDRDKVSAKFKNGVLTVTLPKTEKARKEIKKIAIKS